VSLAILSEKIVQISSFVIDLKAMILLDLLSGFAFFSQTGSTISKLPRFGSYSKNQKDSNVLSTALFWLR